MKTSFPTLRNLKHAGLGAVAALAFALPSSPALAGALDDIKARGEFTYGLEAQYRPFEFRDENNEIVGYDIDVANEIAIASRGQGHPGRHELGGGDPVALHRPVRPHPRRHDRYPRTLQAGELLLSLHGGQLRPARAGGKRHRRRDRPRWQGGRAGAGTPSIKMLQMSAEEHGHEFDGDIKTYDDDAVAYEAMRAGRVEAYASSIVSLMEFAKTTDGEFAVVPFTSKHWGQEFTCMAFRKEDEDLRGAFNDLIAEMKADGTLEALQMKWFGQSFVDLLPNVPPEW